jgi:hypothetical protein
MWGGHSCPPLLKLSLGLEILNEYCDQMSTTIKINVKGGGQGRPPYTVRYA